MLKGNKVFIYLKHVVNMSFNNKPRVVLSLVGLTVGLFIFTLGNILIDSYYNDNLRWAWQMANETLVLEVQTDNQDNLTELTRLNREHLLSSVSLSSPSTIFIAAGEDGSLCSLSAAVMGVSELDKIVPVHHDIHHSIGIGIDLLRGRLIDANDVALQRNVVVIDQFTEDVLFQGSNSLGKYLYLDVEAPGISSVHSGQGTNATTRKLEIIGVMKNSYASKVEKMEYRKFVAEGGLSFLSTTIYCPITILDIEEDIAPRKLLMWNIEDKNIYADMHQILVDYGHVYRNDFSSYNVITRNDVILDVVNQLKPMRSFLNVMLAIILLISGVSTMSTMFFSVKERINEIGIKKALGATELDILCQYVLEGMLLSFIAAIIAVCLSSLLALILQNYLFYSMHLLFEISLSLRNLLLPILLAGIYGFVFSLIPSYYGARIMVTHALRFE